jgi:hypothetical protein
LAYLEPVAAGNDLAKVQIIWIKSDGTPTGIPDGAWALFESDTLPASWTRVYGNKYLFGSGGGNDSNLSTSAVSTHQHDDYHLHTQDAHSHGASTTANASPNANRRSGAGNTASAGGHSHGYTLDSVTGTDDAASMHSAGFLESVNNEPLYMKLNLIENGTGGASLPDQTIAVWGGAHADIPTDWARYTALDDLFVKSANADGESGIATGGAISHTHVTGNCQPTQVGHNHAVTQTSISGTQAVVAGAQAASNATHVHSYTVDSTAPTYNAVSTNGHINACDDYAAYPVHRLVIFIQYTAPASTYNTAQFMMVM